MKQIITASLLVILLQAGACERYIDSSDPVRSIPDNGPIPYNLTALMDDGSITLIWDVADPASIGTYRIYAAIDPEVLGQELDYILRDSSTTRSIELDELLFNKHYFFKVAAVSKSGLEWEMSEAIDAMFTHLSIALETGAEWANSTSIRVQINAPTTTSHIRLSEDETFTSDYWIPFMGTVTNFELSEGDGTKWVYCQLQFGDGSKTGAVLSDSIVLDTRAEITSVSWGAPSNGSYFEVGETITFSLVAGETGGEAIVSFGGGFSGALDLLDDATGGDLTADDGIYTGKWDVPPSFILDHGEMTGHFTDAAGNSAPDLRADVLLTIFTPPQPVAVTATVQSTHEINLTWTRSTSSGDNFAAYRVYRNGTSVVTESSTLVHTETVSTNTSFTDSDLDDDERLYYRVYAYDKSGLSSESEVVNARTMVNAAPDPVELYVVDNGDSTSADLAWSESNEDYFESYRIYRSAAVASQPSLGQFTTLVWVGTTKGTVQRAGINLPETSSGNYYFVIYVFDGHGDSTASNIVSAPAP